MSTDIELALSDRYAILEADTGEPLDHTSSDAAIAQGILLLRRIVDLAKVEQYRLSTIVVERMDADASWTRRAGGLTLSAPSPSGKSEWSAPDLRRVLGRLVADGTLTKDAVERCFRQKEEVAARGVTAVLSALEPADQASVRACNVPKKTATRSVSVA